MRTSILSFTVLTCLIGCESDGDTSSGSSGTIGSSGMTGPTGTPGTATGSGSTTGSSSGTSEGGSSATGGGLTTTGGDPTTASGNPTSAGSTSDGSAGSTTSPCQPGTQGCQCLDEQCLGGELQCIDGRCGFPECPNAGEVNCAGDCADLMTDNDHCGQCGRVCQQSVGAGECVAGACEPTWGNNCVNFSDAPAFPTCDAVCADIGEACVAQGCLLDMNTYGVYTECSLGPNGAPAFGGIVACSDPIDWDGVGGGVVRCCCTQT